MAYAIAGPAQGLAPRRAIELANCSQRSLPSFEAAVAFIKARHEVVGEGDPTENFFLVVSGY